jgi:hypothetical protein
MNGAKTAVNSGWQELAANVSYRRISNGNAQWAALLVALSQEHCVVFIAQPSATGSSETPPWQQKWIAPSFAEAMAFAEVRMRAYARALER